MNQAKPSQRFKPTLILMTALVTIIAMLAVTIHEGLFPELPTWESHLIMAVVAGVLVAASSYFVLRSQYALYGQLEETQSRLLDYTNQLETQIVARDRMAQALQASEERLRLAVDSAMIGYWDWHIESNQITWGGHHDQLFGLEPGAFARTYDAFLQLVYPDDRERVRQTITSVLQSGVSYEELFRIRWSDGSIHWIRSQGRVYRTAQGQPTRIIGVVQDVTTRKQAEDTLRTNEQRYRSLFEQNNDSVTLIGLDGIILTANQRAAEMYGYTVEEMTNAAMAPFIVPDEYPQTIRALDLLQTEARLPLYERTFRKKDGTTFCGEVNAAVVRDASGRPLYVQSIVRDITERKKAEDALRRSEARYRAISEDQGEFIVRFLPDGTLTFVNDSYCRDMGKPREALIGWNFITAMSAEDRHRIERHLASFSRACPVRTYEHSIAHRGRAVRWRHWTDRAIFDNQDHITEFQSLGIDITDRKQAEAALRQSEERFAKVFNASPAAIAINDLKTGRYIDVNDSYLQLVGYSRAEIINHTADEYGLVVGPNDRQIRVQMVQEQGSLRNIDVRLRTKAGETRDALVSIEIMTLNGEDCVVALLLDITERKRVELALRQSEAAEHEQRLLAEAMRDSIAALTSTLDIESVMRRILENAGRVVPHEAASIVLLEDNQARIAYWRNYPPETVAFFQQSLFLNNVTTFREMQHSGKALLIADTAADADWVTLDTAKWIRSYLGVPIRAHGTIIGILNLDSATPGYFTPTHAERLQVFADQAGVAIENAQLYAKISRSAEELGQRVAERTRELTQANQQLLVLDRLKNKFIADISHELRTPVANLNMRMYLLEHDTADKRAEHITVLNNQLVRLNELLESVLDFSQLDETYGGDIGLEQVNINAVVQEVVDAYRSRAEAARLRLMFDLGADLPPVYATTDYIYRILVNLLTNAISYTPSGRIEVRTFASAARDEVCLEVQDTGIGIEPEDMPHLLEQFYRGKHVGSSAIPGAGLGLSIVKEIVDQLRGQIEVSSEPNTGSRFRIRLPVDRSCAPSTTTLAQQPDGGSSAPHDPAEMKC
ncbi:MAG: PAS domain S-box protein [Anaerolineae bacterium]|nr:PAS domain S-box protein [Anaerolineae bacterium]